MKTVFLNDSVASILRIIIITGNNHCYRDCFSDSIFLCLQSSL